MVPHLLPAFRADIGAEVDEKALDGLVYGVAELRKRRGWVEGGGEEAKDDAAGEGEAEDAAVEDE